jgi:hypothetical protein
MNIGKEYRIYHPPNLIILNYYNFRYFRTVFKMQHCVKLIKHIAVHQSAYGLNTVP